MGLHVNHRKAILAAGVAIGALGASNAASAQTTAATGAAEATDIIVTANKREERLFEVAASMTAVGSEELVNRNLRTIQDFSAQVPGFNFETNGRGTRIILRGVNSGGNSAVVAVNIDETPFSYQSGLTNGAIDTANIDTFDMQRIEVLKGPQGTLYGASAVGGLLKYVTNAPNTEKIEAAAEVGGEIVNKGEAAPFLRGMVNLPFWGGKAALRASGFYQELPGFVDNPVLGIDDANSGKRWGGRIALQLNPTDTFSARITASRQDQSLEGSNAVEVVGANLTPLTPPDNQYDITNNGRLEYNSYFGNPSDNQYQYLNLTMSLDTPFFNLLSSTSYGELSSVFRSDVTQSNAAPGFTFGQAFGPAYGLPVAGLWGRQTNSSTRWNQELRISSLPDARLFGMGFDWQAGLFYAQESVTFSQFFDALVPASGPEGTPLTVPLPPGGSDLPGSYEEYAVFANGTFHLTEALSLTLGGRYSTNNQRSQVINRAGLLNGTLTDIFNPAIRSEESNFTWLTSLRYEIDPNNMVYARVASGYRPGGPVLQIPGAPADFPTSYKSDSVINYEIGYRGQLWDNRFIVDVAGFWLDWTDIQVLSQFISSNGQPFNVQGNGATATSKGVEWNVAVEPLKGLRLSVVGAYTDARLTEDAPAIGALSGARLPQVPKWSNTLNLDYSREFGVDTQAYAGISWQHVGDRRTGYNPNPSFASNYKIPAYDVINAQLGVDLANYSFSIYARNLTDERGFTSYDRGNGFAFTGNAELIQPRTLGVRVGVRF